MADWILAKSFQNSKGPISQLEFSDNGRLLFAGCPSLSDQSIQVYDALQGVHRQTVYSKKYGVDLIASTHAENCILHTDSVESNNQYYPVRYLSMHDNTYLRYFFFHKRKVTALAMAPQADLFASIAAMDALALWDLRVDGPPLASVPISARCQMAFDPSGMVLAVIESLEPLAFSGISSSATSNAAGQYTHTLRLFDMKSYESGPFAAFEFHDNTLWTGLSFSPDGALLLVSTFSGIVYLVDSFDGSIKHVLNDQKTSSVVSFSSRGDLVLCAAKAVESTNVYDETLKQHIGGGVHLWDVKSGAYLKTAVAEQSALTDDPIRIIKANPCYDMFASAHSRLLFWLPNTF